MIVVSNASPLLALGQAGCLVVLRDLFGTVYLPESVYQEVVVQCPADQQRRAIEAVIDDFLTVKTPELELPFSRNLGAGERGVLALAVEFHADLVLMDDKKARNEAKEQGLKTAFTSDVLLYAKESGLLESADAVLETLRAHRIYLP